MNDYESAYKTEGSTSDFEVGINIRVASPVGLTDGIRRAARQAAEILEQAITRDFYANDEASQNLAKDVRYDLIACFPDKHVIFVKAIPNGYCSRACCEHLPWFRVTSRVGVIKIGWRKRVIEIDWSDSIIAANANDLFPNEDVTKEGQTIHAWGYEKAREYISVLFDTGLAKGEA